MDKYYTVNQIDLAKAIVWLTGQSFMKFDDKRDVNKKIFSFKNTEKVQLAVKQLVVLKNDLKNIQ